MQLSNVSIHAPAWGATTIVGELHITPEVSIHAPAWGATHTDNHANEDDDVSIHAPAWGATPGQSYRQACDEFQSTRPHGARRTVVSTDCSSRLFQSTRPHGARLVATAIRFRSFSFNPRARMGRDQGCIAAIGARTVSIHAPAWGATAFFCALFRVPHVSIHAPAWGATCKAANLLHNRMFQSTRPHGARLQ